MKKILAFLLVISLVFCAVEEESEEDVNLQFKIKIKNPLKKIKDVITKPVNKIKDAVKKPVSKILDKAKAPLKKVTGFVKNLAAAFLGKLVGGQMDESQIIAQFIEFARPLCLEFCTAYGPEDECNAMADLVFAQIEKELKGK